MKSEMGILTGDAHVSFAALGGPRGAPSHALTPEVLGPKQLLHLLTCDLYAGFSHHQACEDRWKTAEGRGANAEASGANVTLAAPARLNGAFPQILTLQPCHRL